MKRKSGKHTVAYTGSMVEPSNPYSRQVWEQRRKEQHREQQRRQHPKQSKNWFFPIVIAIIVLVIIPLAIIAVFSKNKSTDEQPTEIAEPEISDEEDLAEYYYQLVSDPDYTPLFDNDTSRYDTPPKNITCDSLKAVSKMNADMLNLYLDSGYVVAITDGPDSVLVYQGALDIYSYRAIPINCPSAINTSKKPLVYSANELFDNATSSRSYAVWIDPANLNQEVEVY